MYLLVLGGLCYLFSRLRLHTYSRPRLINYLLRRLTLFSYRLLSNLKLCPR
jgi:hypothetical protein